MKEAITLKNLLSDMCELSYNLVVSKMDSIAINYASDNPLPEGTPPALEIAAFKSLPNHSKYQTPDDRPGVALQAANCFLKSCNITNPNHSSEVADFFLRIQEKAGDLKGFLPNEKSAGVRLIYSRHTFVFIVTPGDLYEYTL